jgi:molybdopterin converting factor small subunit
MRALRLTVLYFASARDAAGRGSEPVSVDEASTVNDLASRLQELHPKLKPMGTSTRYAVNRELVDGGTALHDGDEVGVLPAVTGG